MKPSVFVKSKPPGVRVQIDQVQHDIPKLRAFVFVKEGSELRRSFELLSSLRTHATRFVILGLLTTDVCFALPDMQSQFLALADLGHEFARGGDRLGGLRGLTDAESVGPREDRLQLVTGGQVFLLQSLNVTNPDGSTRSAGRERFSRFLS